MRDSRHNYQDRPSPWRSALKVFGITSLFLFLGAASAAVGLHWKLIGARDFGDYIHRLGNTTVALRDPRAFFPGKERLTVLCLGLDRNIFTTRNPKLKHLNGQPYTKGARTDVMMVASLDLRTREVSILSIPRDTRVELPSGKTAKINQAHADGGIPYTRETVEKFLGVPVDYHVVIKQEAIEKVVNALGGVKINVEGALINGERRDMDYDDNWGQLHVHLKRGPQKLNGEQVVGYMRFRHDAEGDFGRIRRQQQVIQALSGEVKSPTVLLRAGSLIDAIRSSVQTDLDSDQQLALAHLFHKVDSSNIQTTQLPIADDVTVRGVSYLEPDDFKKEAVVDWILRGDANGMNRLIRISLKNASGDRALYQKVYRCLRAYGFEVARNGRAPQTLATTRAVQHGNLRGAARRVLQVLNVPGDVQKDDERGPDVTLYVGKDLINNQVVALSDMWPETPVRSVRLASRSGSSRRPRARAAEVEIRPVSTEPEATEETAPVEEVAPEPEPDAAPDTPGEAEKDPPAAPERDGQL